MQMSVAWLSEWINVDVSVKELADALTLAGLEVGAVQPVAPPLADVVVGHVLSKEKHPEADRLSVCQVDVGEEAPLQIVCGDQTLPVDARVPVGKVGAQLPGIRLKKAKLRGVESFGMLCAAQELGLSDVRDGVWTLPSDAPIGMPLTTYLQLEDSLLDLEITPNRGDCLSIRGVARDWHAISGAAWTGLVSLTEVEATCDVQPTVNLESSEACTRYVARAMCDIDATCSAPMMVHERLRRSGMRSVHVVVDILNYVMMELGQPMHAFDADCIQGALTIRDAKEGESVVLLDGSEVQLVAGTLVIADDAGVQAIAGVMGALSSAVTEKTKHIYIEVAAFTPATVLSSVRHYGLGSESSYRYERGVDPQMQREVVERVTALLLETVGGTAGPVVECVSDTQRECEAIELSLDGQRDLLGIDVPADRVESILATLGFASECRGDVCCVTPPSYRFDMAIDRDVMEEVLRVYGYDQVPEKSMALDVEPIPSGISSLRRCHHILTSRGYHEAVTYSFVEPDFLHQLNPGVETVSLQNPLSQEMSVMRTMLWPGLLRAAQKNISYQQRRVRLFEVGRCFECIGTEVVEHQRIGGLIVGARHELQWGESERLVDFFDIKGDVMSLLVQMGCEESSIRWVSQKHAALHEGQSAQVFVKETLVGWVGALHPAWVSACDFLTAPYLFELDCSIFARPNVVKYEPFSKYPGMSRDLALVVNSTVLAQDLQFYIESIGGYLLNKVTIFDIYEGEAVSSNEKSVGLRLYFQGKERTLVDLEVSELMVKIVSALEKEFGARLRG